MPKLTANVPRAISWMHQANILAVVEGLQEDQPHLLKVLLADFGEAKQLTQVRPPHTLLPTEGRADRLQLPGVAESMTRVIASAAGTPLYMAPEMLDEEEAKTPKVCVCQRKAVLSVCQCVCQRPSSVSPSDCCHTTRIEQADVFSAGVVVIELSTGEYPKPGPSMRRVGALPTVLCCLRCSAKQEKGSARVRGAKKGTG